mgnify:CR=1 FL=1
MSATIDEHLRRHVCVCGFQDFEEDEAHHPDCGYRLLISALAENDRLAGLNTEAIATMVRLEERVGRLETENEEMTEAIRSHLQASRDAHVTRSQGRGGTVVSAYLATNFSRARLR